MRMISGGEWVGTYISGIFEKVEAKLDDHIVFISQNFGYFACYPPGSPTGQRPRSRYWQITREDSLFHNLDIHFLHVHPLIELKREFSLPQQLCIDSGSHTGRLDNGWTNIGEHSLD